MKSLREGRTPDRRLSERMERLGTETAFEVLVRARALEARGRDVVHLEIGEPDFDTPGHIVEAAVTALRSGATHYGPSAGLPELREAIAADSNALRGTQAAAPNVVVTPGAKPILFFTVLALVDPGDEVIYPNPGFPIYESMIRYIGGIPVPVRLIEEQGYTLDVDQLCERLGPKTRLVILNDPHNPTGGVLPPAAFERIAEAVSRAGVPVLCDEIYSRLRYEGEHRSLAAEPGMEPLAIVLDGFSKTYAMTGWRLGYGIMPEPLARQIAKLQTNSTSCTATFAQHAARAALDGDQTPVDTMRAELRRRRGAIVAGLDAIPGFRCPLPKGAFYAFPNVTGTGLGSRELADRLLEEAGVACLSGASFGSWGEGYLRFSYANSLENIEKALGRVRGLLDEKGTTAS